MKVLLLLLSVLAFSGTLFSQENNTLEDQTIVIYNEFSPVLKDANRILSYPVILDTVKVEPKFEYDVVPTMYKTTFTPSKIPAATVKGEALKPLNTGMIKVGYGNYISPFFEGYVNSKRQKNYSMGLYARHHSSWGKIKNCLDQKIYSAYDDNAFEAYGKRILFKSVLSGKVFFSTNGVNYYGYDPAVYGDVNTINWDSFNYVDTREEIQKQRYYRLGANMRLESEQTGRKHWNYLLDGGYQYFFTQTKDGQHKASLLANIGRTVKKVGYGLDIDFVFNGNTAKLPEAVAIPTVNPAYNEIILNTEPYFTFSSEKWKIRAGVNACGEMLGGVKYHFYPDLFVQLNVSNAVLPYIKYSGHLDNNNLEFVSRINPFVNNYANFGNSDCQHDANVGVKANISKKVFLHINANYSHINSMMFFVNDTSVSPLKNKFTMEYTDVDRVGAYMELALRNIAQGLDISLKGHYYYYIKLANGERPWQTPDIDVSLKASYRLTNKITFGVEGYFLNSCYAKEYLSDGTYAEKKMKSVIDVNLFGEYRFNEKFSVFLNLNNIACQRYYIWNNYRAQGFNAMAGLTYLF